MIKLYNTVEKLVKVTDKVLVTKEEFIALMKQNKASEIYHEYWSKTKPCWVITEYLDDDYIMYYSNAWAKEDRIPIRKKLDLLYKSLKIQGLEHCFIK